MVLQDLGGGRISTVTYGSKDPITKTLKTFAIDLTSNPTLADLLGQIRGEKVEVDAPNAITGTILGVEKRRSQAGKDGQVVEVALLEPAHRRWPAERAAGERRPHQAGQTRRSTPSCGRPWPSWRWGTRPTRRPSRSNFLGRGKRPVRVGYIQESPIWKTSYRLVLKDDEAPFLQGWAIVENTTEEDWKDVDLTLVSGRPISLRDGPLSAAVRAAAGGGAGAVRLAAAADVRPGPGRGRQGVPGQARGRTPRRET